MKKKIISEKKITWIDSKLLIERVYSFSIELDFSNNNYFQPYIIIIIISKNLTMLK